MSSKRWEVLNHSNVKYFANRPLYLCRISVSDSTLVKVRQRIDRPPSLLLDVSSLLYLFILYIVVTFLYMPFVPVYKGFIGIIQFYRSVSPSDFSQSLDEFLWFQSIRLIIILHLKAKKIRKLMSVYVDIGFTLLNATIQYACKGAT